LKPLLREIALTSSSEEVYALFASEQDSVFLDSALDIQGMGRYSFIARDPFLVFTSKGCIVSLRNTEGTTIQTGNPFELLKGILHKYRTDKMPEFPPFTGGGIGYFGYEMGYLLEKIRGSSPDDWELPDCCIGFYDTVVIFDHHKGKRYIASTGFPENDENKRINRANQRIDEFMALLKQAHPLSQPRQPVAYGEYTAHFTKDAYCKMISLAIDYIGTGDIYQVNLSQQFSAKLTVSPFELYRYLRHSNPAPFAAYLNFPEVVVASASPERYLLLKDRMVETRPIKGTRPRGTDVESDNRLREELLASNKDRAELIMIIDLERNDLGKVCEYGSVHVPDIIRLEEYATVFHLVSTVTGQLVREKTIIDLVMASFPGGSITGAPKIRAMEIIDELEPVRRGIYTGSIGYLDFNGDADLNIVIRTFVIKGDEAHFQVGGGIVADSIPELEYQETLDKGRALMHALGYKV
jgi:para-aminobenzoate synthetase component 1